MPVETIMIVAGVIAVFGLFGAALAYVDLIAGARAITLDQERASRAI